MTTINFFIDPILLKAQEPGQNFGIINDTQFKMGSSHKTDVDPIVYSVFKEGQLAIFQIDSDLLTIVLKPNKPFSLTGKFGKIKYIIYKGIKKSSINEATIGSRSTDLRKLVVPDGGLAFNESMLLINIDLTINENYLDDFVFDNRLTFPTQKAKGNSGQFTIGLFNKDSFSMEILIENGEDNLYTIGNLRERNFTKVIQSGANEKRERLAISCFLDLATFFTQANSNFNIRGGDLTYKNGITDRESFYKNVIVKNTSSPNFINYKKQFIYFPQAFLRYFNTTTDFQTFVKYKTKPINSNFQPRVLLEHEIKTDKWPVSKLDISDTIPNPTPISSLDELYKFSIDNIYGIELELYFKQSILQGKFSAGTSENLFRNVAGNSVRRWDPEKKFGSFELTGSAPNYIATSSERIHLLLPVFDNQGSKFLTGRAIELKFSKEAEDGIHFSFKYKNSPSGESFKKKFLHYFENGISVNSLQGSKRSEKKVKILINTINVESPDEMVYFIINDKMTTFDTGEKNKNFEFFKIEPFTNETVSLPQFSFKPLFFQSNFLDKNGKYDNPMVFAIPLTLIQNLLNNAGENIMFHIRFNLIPNVQNIYNLKTYQSSFSVQYNNDSLSQLIYLNSFDKQNFLYKDFIDSSIKNLFELKYFSVNDYSDSKKYTKYLIRTLFSTPILNTIIFFFSRVDPNKKYLKINYHLLTESQYNKAGSDSINGKSFIESHGNNRFRFRTEENALLKISENPLVNIPLLSYENNIFIKGSLLDGVNEATVPVPRHYLKELNIAKTIIHEFFHSLYLMYHKIGIESFSDQTYSPEYFGILNELIRVDKKWYDPKNWNPPITDSNVLNHNLLYYVYDHDHNIFADKFFALMRECIINYDNDYPLMDTNIVIKKVEIRTSTNEGIKFPENEVYPLRSKFVPDPLLDQRKAKDTLVNIEFGSNEVFEFFLYNGIITNGILEKSNYKEIITNTNYDSYFYGYKTFSKFKQKSELPFEPITANVSKNNILNFVPVVFRKNILEKLKIKMISEDLSHSDTSKYLWALIASIITEKLGCQLTKEYTLQIYSPDQPIASFLGYGPYEYMTEDRIAGQITIYNKSCFDFVNLFNMFLESDFDNVL